jgi:hypothetical protein
LFVDNSTKLFLNVLYVVGSISKYPPSSLFLILRFVNAVSIAVLILACVLPEAVVTFVAPGLNVPAVIS